MWFMYGLKAQKLLAQGSALGIMVIGKAPCKGKSLKMHLIKMENPLRYVKLLPLQGARFATHKTPGRCPGLRASAPSGRAAYMGFLPSGRAAYMGFLPSGRAACGRCPGLGASAPYLCFTLRSAIFNSLRPVTVGSGRADCSQLAGIAVYGNAGTRCCCPLTSRTSGGSDNFFNFYNFFNSYNFYNLTSVTEKM